jgi:hypothetical protein
MSAAAQTTGDCNLGSATVDLDVGNVRARMYNTGGLFWIGGSPIYEVPKGSGSNAIFASGLWIGGIVDDELRMAAATYSDWEFFPGPLDGNGNPPAGCSAYDRIYLVSREDLSRYDQTGSAATDLAEWPWELGAPVIDGDGNPDNYDLTGGDRPEMLGDQMAWWVMQDAGNLHLTTETQPMGLEIRVSAFVFERDDVIGNTTFYRYQLVYRGLSPIEEMYFGFWSEPDLGDAGDDYIGSDSLRGLGYVYNGDDFDGGSLGYGYPPPALGYDILKGPLADADGLDNDYDGVFDEPAESQTMTTFMTYQGNSSVQGNPTTALEYYQYLKGEWRDGTHLTSGGSGLGFSNKPTRFYLSGDPPAFWSEDNIDGQGTRNPPDDRRFLMSTGPFHMDFGDTEDIWLAIIWSQGNDRLDSVQELKRNSDRIQAIFDSGFDLPELLAPQTAPLLVAPDDGADGQPDNVTLRWGKVPEASRFIWQVAADPEFDDFVASSLTTRLEITLESPRELAPGSTLWWRVRAVNSAGEGPWSDAWQFALGADSLYSGQSGPVVINDEYMFVETEGPTDEYACGANVGSTFGCDEVGGNHVYGSENGSGDYIMWHEGNGPEWTLGRFSPNDFEIRFTEPGSLAYHAITDGTVIRVPFEVWDIGPTYSGTNVNPNDPDDDVQMIPILFAGGRNECTWTYDESVPGSFGQFGGSTQRIYAYYPTGTYRDWQDAVQPLVEADPDACPNVYDLTNGAIEDRIDFRRGRPLQRIIFNGDSGDVPPHPAFGVVIRFYTVDPILPSAPAPSAPADGAAGLTEPLSLWWTGPPGQSNRYGIQVATSPSFDEPIIAQSNQANRSVIASLPEVGRYYWRVNVTNGNGTSDWSDVWSFTVASLVATEDEGVPDRFALHPNYPNPFNPETTIRFDLPSAQNVALEIFDTLGRRVATLVDGHLPAGKHRARWKADHLASGLYLYRLRAGSFVRSRAMILVK